MADRYWVGGTADWDTTAGTKWATTSGGAGGAAVPTSSDNVYFDANSGAVTVTIPLAANGRPCADLTFTGFTGTFTGYYANVFGSLTMASGMTFTAAGFSFYAAATGKTITSSGKYLGNISFYTTAGGWTFSDDISCAVITLQAGSLATGNYSVSATQLSFSGTSTRSLTLGSSAITLTTSSSYPLYAADTTNLTFDAGTSTITVSDGNAHEFAGGGLTYSSLVIGGGTGTGTFTISGANTFSTLSTTRTSSFTVKFPSSTTTTVGTWGLNGSTGKVVTLAPSSAATTWTLAKSGGGTVTANNISVSYSTASPGSTWSATNSTNGGNNSGWTFIQNASAIFFGFTF